MYIYSTDLYRLGTDLVQTYTDLSLYKHAQHYRI